MTDKTKTKPHLSQIGSDIRSKDVTKCAYCDKGMMHDHNIMFSRVTVERFVIDTRGVQTRHGEELMMGGGQIGAMFAGLMGSDPVIGKQMGDPTQVLVCDTCLISPKVLAVLLENDND